MGSVNDVTAADLRLSLPAPDDARPAGERVSMISRPGVPSDLPDTGARAQPARATHPIDATKNNRDPCAPPQDRGPPPAQRAAKSPGPTKPYTDISQQPPRRLRLPRIVSPPPCAAGPPVWSRATDTPPAKTRTSAHRATHPRPGTPDRAGEPNVGIRHHPARSARTDGFDTPGRSTRTSHGPKGTASVRPKPVPQMRPVIPLRTERAT